MLKSGGEMSDLLDNAKKSFGEWFSKAVDKASEFTREAADRTEEVTKLGKVKLDIFQIKRGIDKVFTDLGRCVYNLLVEETKDIEKNESVKSYIDQVKTLEKNLKEMEDKYERTKNSHIDKPQEEKKKEEKGKAVSKKKS